MWNLTIAFMCSDTKSLNYSRAVSKLSNVAIYGFSFFCVYLFCSVSLLVLLLLILLAPCPTGLWVPQPSIVYVLCRHFRNFSVCIGRATIQCTVFQMYSFFNRLFVYCIYLCTDSWLFLNFSGRWVPNKRFILQKCKLFARTWAIPVFYGN